MLRFVLTMLAAVSFGLLVLVAETLRGPAARAVRAVLLACVALLGAGGVAMGVAGIANDAWWAAVLGGAILIVAVRFGWALRRPRRPSEPLHVPLTRPSSNVHWNQFERQIDWVARQQARRSRKAIDAFLAERQSPSLTHEHRALLLSCEKRIPELIETCVARCRNATAAERDRYVDETLATLTRIGSEAERARREVRAADDQRLDILHRYFGGVAGNKDEQRPLP